ncbi:MAG: hypothetical protein LBD20_05250 [Spirochaetaceae bacterium]|nr:hypothetical protein [Spirochaetaceae bacterium]
MHKKIYENESAQEWQTSRQIVYKYDIKGSPVLEKEFVETSNEVNVPCAALETADGYVIAGFLGETLLLTTAKNE